MAKTQRQTFQNSSELKKLFNQLFEAWSRKYRLGIGDLAERCGASTQYLAHIGRYGRIPGKPILILLALILESPDPSALMRASGLPGPWPFEPGMGLRQRSPTESGFLSLNVDMLGFTSAIREILRSELRPKTLTELLAGRPLRVGLNKGQSFLFGTTKPKSAEGFFPELMRLISLSLHCQVQFVDVLHSDFADALRAGDIDLFGPVFFTPHRMTQALYTTPFCTVELGGIWRTKNVPLLPSLPPPRQLSELRKREYQVAVHKESMSHHFAASELGIPAERLVLCEVPEESVERVLLTSIPRPAHIVLTDRPHAFHLTRKQPELKEIIFGASKPATPPYEDTIAVRSDWAPVVSLLNEMLEFLKRNGSLDRLYQRTIEEASWPGIKLN